MGCEPNREAIVSARRFAGLIAFLVVFVELVLSVVLPMRAYALPAFGKPAPLNPWATTDTTEPFSGTGDSGPALATDGLGTLITIWSTQEDVTGTIGTDRDVVSMRSLDNGHTWTTPVVVNDDASTDGTITNSVGGLGTDGAGSGSAPGEGGAPTLAGQRTAGLAGGHPLYFTPRVELARWRRIRPACGSLCGKRRTR